MKNDINFTPRAETLIKRAKKLAKESNNNYVTRDYLFLAFLEFKQGIVSQIFKKSNYDVLKSKLEVIEYLSLNKCMILYEDFNYSADFLRTVSLSKAYARDMKQSHVGTEHLFLALIKDKRSYCHKKLKKDGLDLESISKYLTDKLDPSGFEKEVIGDSSEADSESESNAINTYCIDLVSKAESGEIGPIFGRDEETDRCIEILCKRHKSNPIIIGEAGVGKTALAENLAIRIFKKQVPKDLINKRILLLDFFLMLAGSRYRGDFEERLKNLVKEIKERKDCIIIVDEIHAIVGSGSNNQNNDAANMLKPALSRGELSCIGTTTKEEYNRYIVPDSALSRRFQPIELKEPNKEETKQIIDGLLPVYAKYHNVKFKSGIAKYMVDKSDSIKGKNPDKSIDLLDESCVKCKICKPDTVKPLVTTEHVDMVVNFHNQKFSENKKLGFNEINN